MKEDVACFVLETASDFLKSKIIALLICMTSMTIVHISSSRLATGVGSIVGTAEVPFIINPSSHS